MKKEYYIPTVEIALVNTVLMAGGLAQISGKGGYGSHAPARRDKVF